jgi:hypothetical protein
MFISLKSTVAASASQATTLSLPTQSASHVRTQTLSVYNVRIPPTRPRFTYSSAPPAMRGSTPRAPPALFAAQFIPTALNARLGRYALSVIAQRTGPFKTARANAQLVFFRPQESASSAPLSIPPAQPARRFLQSHSA